MMTVVSRWNRWKTVATRSSAIAEGPRDASCQLKSCQLPRNSAETTCTTSPEVMKLEGYSGTMCNKHVHSTMTRSSRFYCPIGVINKPTTDDLRISPVYRRLAVAKFSNYTASALSTLYDNWIAGRNDDVDILAQELTSCIQECVDNISTTRSITRHTKP